MPNEETAIVLDYLPKGKSSAFKPEPLAQVLGKKFFTLLEVVPKSELKIMEEVSIGKEARDKIEFIKKRVTYKELTSTSVAEINKAIEKIIHDDNQRFLDFFNKSGSISIRMHQLELLPGLGKKHMLDLLDERKKKPFESFEDIEKRIKLMPNPVQTVVKRILMELQEDDLKHYVFARPPYQEREFEQRSYQQRRRNY
ncbi:MAG: DUF655 domain-containing protein [archaeon]|nr:DUF655 domain-containing protein [archaeon]